MRLRLPLAKLSIIGFTLFAFLYLSCKPPEEPDPMEEDPMEMEEEEEENRTYITEQHTVGDIEIEIYVPSDFMEGSRYPTLYFNDGDLFADVFGILTSLEADPFIMVGVWDDQNRAARFSAYQDDELTSTYGPYEPGAAAYTQALIDEVIPFVEAKYKSSKRGLFGISLGGLHATWAGIKYPGVFAFTGALSPSYWVGEGALLNEPLDTLRPVGPSSAKVFYVDRGTEEWRNFMPLVEGLKQVDLQYGKNIFYYEVFGADHDVPSWLLRVEVPFRLFLEGTGDITDLELTAYCADNLDMPGSKQARVNPVVSYSNGVKFSVMTEAEFQVMIGDGNVLQDGTYSLNSGTSITIESRYMGFTKQTQANECN